MSDEAMSNFTPRAQQVLALARKEADRFNHNFVGTGPDQKVMGNIPYTPRVKKVLALAQKEAKALNHTYVGTEHILLGLLREGDGVAARVLKSLDVDIEQTRNEILKELDPNFTPPTGEEGVQQQEGSAPPAGGGAGVAGDKKEVKTP